MNRSVLLLPLILIKLLIYSDSYSQPSVSDRIDITLKMLQKNKSDYWKLTGKIESHLKNKVTNVADRQLIGLFKILGRHQQLNEDLAKIDAKLDLAYKKWRNENPGYNRYDWKKQGLERLELIKLSAEKSQLWSQYINDQGHYRHKVMTGKDGVLIGLQNQQDRLLKERKRLTQLLRELQLQLAKNLKQPLTFHILGDLTRWVDKNDTEIIEFVISHGTPPFSLQYSTPGQGLINKSINKLGKFQIKHPITIAEDTGLIVFYLEDKQRPKNMRSESVSFIYTGDDTKPRPDESKSTSPTDNVNGKGQIKKPSYDEIIIKNQCEQLDQSSAAWQQLCQPDNPLVPISGTLRFDFSCGDAFELSPNDILYPKTCDVIVKTAGNLNDKIILSTLYNKNLLDITFDEQEKNAEYQQTRFLLIIRTIASAPPGLTELVIKVKQGTLESEKLINIAILPPGIEPSSGSGIRPPADVETGSGGDYCVWRSKSFGDKPKCFNISTAKCDHPNYEGHSKYELVGSNLTQSEASKRAYILSPYKGNLYGCDNFEDNRQATKTDKDKDSIADELDNCPNQPNPNQLDTNANGIGDACEKPTTVNDQDNDGIMDAKDNCPSIHNSNQIDTDNNGTGDACQNQHNTNDLSNADCSAYQGMQPIWDELTQSIGCTCQGNQDWSDQLNRCADKIESILAETDCSAFGAAKAVYDNASNQAMCECHTGYEFDDNNICTALTIDENCTDYPGTIYQNNQCQCPGTLEWSESKRQCVNNADLTQADIDCTAYAGSVPKWNETDKNWQCLCIGNKTWSSRLNACAYAEDEAVADLDCSSYQGAIAQFNDFTGQVECQCQNGFKLDSISNSCEAQSGNTSNQAGNTVLPTPEIILPGECNVLYDDGSDQPESYVFKVQGISQIKLNYDTDSIKDNISILSASRKELWRSGCVGTGSYKTKILDIPNGTEDIIIDVHPNCDGKSSGTSWKFKAECL
ncbi:MAG: thrombospondin type 3 repeat-containing protein [Marinicellaceae bacterium]